MSKEIPNSKISFIPLRDIDEIIVHHLHGFYLIVIKKTGRVWYAKEFKADNKGLHGEFREDRF